MMPEGSIVCSVESQSGDRGKIARASGNYATVISHNPDTKKTRIKMPSGMKKTVPSNNRAIVGKLFIFITMRVYYNASLLFFDHYLFRNFVIGK